MLADPDLALLQEEQAVDEHAGDRDQAQAKRQAPHGLQRAVVVVLAGLAEDGQQDADDGRVNEVAPALRAARMRGLTSQASSCSSPATSIAALATTALATMKMPSSLPLTH